MVTGIVSPDESHEGLHHVDVHVVSRVVTGDWQVEVDLGPPLECFPEHVLVQTRQVF